MAKLKALEAGASKQSAEEKEFQEWVKEQERTRANYEAYALNKKGPHRFYDDNRIVTF